MARRGKQYFDLSPLATLFALGGIHWLNPMRKNKKQERPVVRCALLAFWIIEQNTKKVRKAWETDQVRQQKGAIKVVYYKTLVQVPFNIRDILHI